MDKYVAFLDILGFKSKIKQIGQNKAREFIKRFSSAVYQEWVTGTTSEIEGFIVSDSFIINSRNATQLALGQLLDMVDIICKRLFFEYGIPVRGGIAKGEFDRAPVQHIPDLEKSLLVGQAYVDAYSLESSEKTIGLILSEAVYTDIDNGCFDCIKSNCFKEQNSEGTSYILRYISIDYLLHSNNIESFTRIASDSEWMPHYYNTL